MFAFRSASRIYCSTIGDILRFSVEYDETSPRQALKNNGPQVQGGSAEGIMIGGNLCSLNLLNGTEYFPKIEGDIILCIEDDSYDSIPETG